MSHEVKVLAISGSLRKGSYNSHLVQACHALAPEGMTVEVYEDLEQIPPYNDDVRAAGYPDTVHALRERIRAADALIVSTPEYNRSFSGVIKNAIDWVSRPPEQPLDRKVALVMGAATGPLGTALGNYELRQVLSVCNVITVPGREVLVSFAAEKFDAEGNLVDEATSDFLAKNLAELRRLAVRLRHDPEA